MIILHGYLLIASYTALILLLECYADPRILHSDGVIAPGYKEEALKILSKKKGGKQVTLLYIQSHTYFGLDIWSCR